MKRIGELDFTRVGLEEVNELERILSRNGYEPSFNADDGTMKVRKE